MSTGKPRPVWYGAVVALGAILLVSVYALVKEWDARSWLIGAILCLVTGGMVAVSQARTNQKLDELADDADEGNPHSH